MLRFLSLLSLLVFLGCESKPETTIDPAQKARHADAADRVENAHDAGGVEDPKLRVQHDGRVVAIADVHGDVDALVRILEAADLIDENKAWSGEDAILVQTGDILDRGATEREAYDLLFALREDARKAGGDIIMLIGNHEMMNALGDLRYVTPEAMDDFDDSVSPGQMAQAQEAPEEVRGRFAAWRPGGPWARRLSDQGFTVIVNDTVFVHGGIEPNVAPDVGALNKATRSWLAGDAELPETLAAQHGPVWSRIYSGGAPRCDALEAALSKLGAARMVVGHTVQKTPGPACNDRIWRIDAGMSAHYGGTASALEISNGEAKLLSADSH